MGWDLGLWSDEYKITDYTKLMQWQRIEKKNYNMKKPMAIKYWSSYLHVFSFLHKKSFSIVTQLHMQVDRFSIYLNVHLKMSNTRMYQ